MKKQIKHLTIHKQNRKTHHKLLNLAVMLMAYFLITIYNMPPQPLGGLMTFLVIKVQINDYAVGNLYIALTFKENYVTVMFKKVEETFLMNIMVYLALMLKIIKIKAIRLHLH